MQLVKIPASAEVLYRFRTCFAKSKESGNYILRAVYSRGYRSLRRLRHSLVTEVTHRDGVVALALSC